MPRLGSMAPRRTLPQPRARLFRFRALRGGGMTRRLAPRSSGVTQGVRARLVLPDQGGERRRGDARGRTRCLHKSSRVRSTGGGAGGATSVESSHRIRSIAEHVSRNFVPYGLVAVIAVSTVWPALGLSVKRSGIHKLSAPGIFFISGLLLKMGDVRRALESPMPVLLGYALILLVLPLAAFPAAAWPYLRRDLVNGAAIFLCMPTALSTGVQICSQAGGNAALALMLTVGSSIASVATIPTTVSRVLGGDLAFRLDAARLLTALAKSILAPLLAGMALRAASRRGKAAIDSKRKPLSLLSGTMLVLVPLAELSSAMSNQMYLGAAEIGQLVALGCAIPATFLAFNSLLMRTAGRGFPEDIKRTLVVVCSIKTLPTAVMVVQSIQQVVPTFSGIALLPCMIFHILQIMVVSVLASRWRKRDARVAEAG